MLRVFIDTNSKVLSEDFESINVQYLSIIDKVNNEYEFNRFKEYIVKSLENGDKIIILSKIEIKPFIEHNNLVAIIAPLNDRGMELTLSQIQYYKNEELSVIREKLRHFLELFEFIYHALVSV